MNIRVQGPDGVIIEFPEGTGNDVITGVMQKRYGGPKAQQPQAPQAPASPDAIAADPMGTGISIQQQSEAPPAMPYGEQMRKAFGFMGRAADDAVRVGSNAATFGLADRFAGMMTGDGKEAERAKTAASRERLGPVASTAIDVGGALVPMSGAANLGLSASKLIPQTNVLGRLAAAGADATAFGAANAAGNDREIMKEALLSGAGGLAGAGAGEAISAGGKALGSLFRTRPNVPTAEELKSAANAAYAKADASGAMYSNNALQGLTKDLEAKYASIGYDPALQPGASVVFKKVQEAADKGLPITIQGADTLRKIAGNAFIPGNKSNNRLVGDAVRSIDDMVANPANAVAGKADEAASALKEARDLYSRTAKQNTIDDAIARASSRTSGTGSGGNIDNAVRQELRKIITDPRKSRGFTPDEIGAIRDAVDGSPAQNLMRLVGKLSPSGNGLMLALQAGAAGATGGASLPAAGAGIAAKTIADSITKKNAEKIGQIIRAGGSKDAAFGKPTALERLSEDKRKELVRALLLGGAITAPREAAK